MSYRMNISRCEKSIGMMFEILPFGQFVFGLDVARPELLLAVAALLLVTIKRQRRPSGTFLG
jgi:hypothetical protein